MEATLKQKLKDRNRDIHISDMTNYQETKDLIKEHQKEIDTISNTSLELKSNSTDIKNEINELKKVLLKDNLFFISKEQKDQLENYIDKVDKTTDKYRDVKELSANLNIIAKQARQDSKKIRNLREYNEALELRVDNLTTIVNEQQNKIDELRQDNFNLKYRLQQLEQIFKNFVNPFKRMIKRKDKEKSYVEILEDMHNHIIISTDTYDKVLGYGEQKKKKMIMSYKKFILYAIIFLV